MLRNLLFSASIVGLAALGAQAQDMSVDLGDVVVTGSRALTSVHQLPMTISTVDSAKLTANERTSILPTLTEQVPGLFVTSRALMGNGVSNGAAGGISLRGLGGGQARMLMLIDGHPQYQGIYGHPISDSYQTMFTDHVEVLRGPASVLYGTNAMGGVINIVSRTMPTDGTRSYINLGAGSYGTFKAEAGNQYRNGKFSSTVSANYGRSDNHRPHLGFEQFGGYARLGYDLSRNWKLWGNFDITRFIAEYAGSTTSPLEDAKQWITRGVANVVAENHYERTSGAISAYYNFGHHRINDGHSPSANPQTNYFMSDDAIRGISAYQTVKLFTGNHITLGFDWQNVFGHTYYHNIETGEHADVAAMMLVNETLNDVAGYVDVRQDFNRWLTLEAGIRVDNYNDHTEWIPQGGLVVRPFTDGTFKFMVGKGFRNPILREMYLYRPANEELRPERLVSYEISWNHSLLNHAFTYGFNLFHIDGDNMIATAMVDGSPRNINTGTISNNGIELEAAYRINEHWSVNTNHSYLHMKHPVLGAPEYKGYAGATMRYGKWNATSGLMIFSGLYKSVGTTESKENAVLLNATVGYQLLQNLRLWINGENLLAERYEINAGYPMPKATFMAGVNLTF